MFVGIVIAISGWFVVELAGNARTETDLDKYMPQDHPAFASSD